MATVQTLRPAPETTGAEPERSPGPGGMAAFHSGREEDRLTDLLAYAMAVRDGQPATPEQVERLRRQAVSELHDHAFRTLHNRVSEIRQQAVTEHLGRLGRPAGFGTMLLAALAALAVAASTALWLAAHPDALHRLLDAFSGLGV